MTAHAPDRNAPATTVPELAWMPDPMPRAMGGIGRAGPTERIAPAGMRASASTQGPRIALATITFALAGGLIWIMAQALLATGAGATPVSMIVLALFAISVLWTASAAGVALIGVLPAPAAPPGPPADWKPTGRDAILILLCGEPARPVVRRILALRHDLARAGLQRSTDIFLLSDTSDAAHIAAEAQALSQLRGLPGVFYRRRATNEGRKPGNIADWVRHWGNGYDHMLVLDSDSRMTARRIRALIHRMEQSPDTALIQTGMRLVPDETRFGALQRLSGRLCGPGFGRGFAAWTGAEGNFWGHNAIIRIAAFSEAAALPRLSGRAPFGGDILSHDFIEAAWLRRAGWKVVLDPETRGSFEEGPQNLAEFHRRDRRWCQGNLQHIRLIGAPGLHPVSRLHLASGIQSYLSAPLWLALVLVVALGRPGLDTVLPLLGGLGLLLVPKLAGGWHWLRRCRTMRRRFLVLRALVTEVALSTLVAPILLLRQSAAVVSVLAGRDCGWRPGAANVLPVLPRGLPEALAGLALAGLAAGFADSPAHLALLLPVLAPLIAAPLLIRWLEGPVAPRDRAGAAISRWRAALPIAGTPGARPGEPA